MSIKNKHIENDEKISLSHEKEIHSLIKKSIPKEISVQLSRTLNILISERGLDPDNLIYIVTNLMSTVAKYKKLTGSEKKEIVIILINEAIDKVSADEQNIILKLMMDTIVPNTIDILVDVSKGRYKFKYLPKIYACIKACI